MAFQIILKNYSTKHEPPIIKCGQSLIAFHIMFCHGAPTGYQVEEDEEEEEEEI